MCKIQRLLFISTIMLTGMMDLTCKQSTEPIITGMPPKAAQGADATNACLFNNQTINNGQETIKTLYNPNVADCSQKMDVNCLCNQAVLSCPSEANAVAQGFTQAACGSASNPATIQPIVPVGPPPPASTPGSGMSDYVLGLYDNAGEHLLAAGGADRGWVLVNRHLISDRHSGSDAIAMDLISRGFGVITRLNWDFEGVGTIPAPGTADEGTMLAKLRDMVSQTPSAKVWIIGNEPNRKAESYDKSQAIPPRIYANFFNKARTIIKGLSGHENDIVMPAALAPASGDYNTAQYFREMIQEIPAFDAIAVHAKPDSGVNGFFLFNEGDAITTHAKAQGKLIFITETNPKGGWRDGVHDTWVSQALNAVKTFNDKGHAKIAAMVVYRYEQGQRSEENLRGRDAIESDFKNAANLNIRWR